MLYVFVFITIKLFPSFLMFCQDKVECLSLTTGNTKGGSITVQLTFSLTGLDYSVLQIKTKIVSSHTADSKPVKQEVNGTVILPPLVFLAYKHRGSRCS
jgi:hypothetical protein